MLLAHHRNAVTALRAPSAEDPWRVLVSGCLASWGCGVNGTDYGLGAVMHDFFALAGVRALPFCPEQHAMGTRARPASTAPTSPRR
jgi:hypothetical protein